MDFESQLEKIVKDIRDREDREMALAFTNVVGSLLGDNGVFVKTSRNNFGTDKEFDKNKYIIKKEFGISIDGLDFSEHDKRFKDEIRQLKHELEKTYNQLMEVEKESQERIAELKSELEIIRTRCHESARDSFDSGMYGCLHIVTADELKTTKDVNDRTVELPFDALETANMLINATYRRKANGIDRLRWCEEDTVETDMYSVNDLEQIAEHLLVYCKHNRESEE